MEMRVIRDKQLFLKYMVYLAIAFIATFTISAFVIPGTSSWLYSKSTCEAITMAVNNPIDSNVFFVNLLIHNCTFAFILVCAGLVGYELISFLLVMWNAFNVGAVIAQLNNVGASKFILTIAPHAPIETLGLLLCGAASCVIAYRIRERGHNILSLVMSKDPAVRDILVKDLLIPCLVLCLPAIILGVVIESYVTLGVYHWVYG